MKPVEISVLMPVYNSENYLREAINSILSQTFQNFELLIINDGSKDRSEEIIKSFNDNRIVYIKNEKNLGLVATLNIGLRIAKGNFIARMDQDDISTPERFEKQLRFLKANPDVAVVSSKLMMINEEGKEIGFWNDDFDCTTQSDILINMPKLNCIGHPTVMMRSKIVKQFGYNKKFKNSEDWGLWLTLLSNNFIIAKIDEVLLKYRIHSTGTIVNANKENVSKRIIRFKRKYIFDKVINFQFKNTDKKVFKYYLRDWLRYYLPFVYSFMVKWIGTDLKVLLSQRRAFKKIFNDFPKDSNAIFFFPFCHLGGAEVVHSEIVETVSSLKPIVIFTSHTGKKTLLDSFKKNAVTLDFDQLTIWPFTKKWAAKKIYEACERNVSLVLFSSNSKFFYEVVSGIPAHTKAIDLVHAFMHKHEDSSEKWSLPVVNNLSARVIINKKTREDFTEQYSENKVPSEFVNRIIYISNYVEKKEKPVKDFEGKIKIVFVGRGTSEKRVHLLAAIAKELKIKNLPVEFHFVGDLENSIPADCKESCIIHGEITDVKKLNEVYAMSHLLAMASTREGFPMVIMEGMMNGVVPVTTNVGGIPQHITSSRTGILINEIEPSHFSRSFINEVGKLISDRNKLEELSNNCYNYAIEHFNKNKFSEAYLKLFSN